MKVHVSLGTEGKLKGQEGKNEQLSIDCLLSTPCVHSVNKYS